MDSFTYKIFSYNLFEHIKRLIFINIIIIIAFIIIATTYQFQLITKVHGLVEGGYLYLQISENLLSKLNEKEVLFNNEELEYLIHEVSSEIIWHDKEGRQRLVTLKTSIEKDDFVELNILSQPTTVKDLFLNYIKEMIK